VIKKGVFEVTMDTAFDRVSKNCAEIKQQEQQGTWITEEMIGAYISLHSAGYAHL